jgi:hypothetical protein
VISALITEHVGPKRALELMMTGRRLSAAEAREWGLVNQVVPRTSSTRRSPSSTGSSSAGAPLALALGRRSYHQAREMGPDGAMAYLHGMLDLTVQTEDVVEGVTAFFEKRDPSGRAGDPPRSGGPHPGWVARSLARMSNQPSPQAPWRKRASADADETVKQLSGPLKQVLGGCPRPSARCSSCAWGCVDGHPHDLADTARALGLSMSEARDIERGPSSTSARRCR